MSPHDEYPEETGGLALDERELIGLLAPERPDPGEFAAGVRERVEELERDAELRASEFEGTGAARTLRRAAALLPPGTLESLAFGRTATIAAAKQAGATGTIAVPGVWALPFLTLGAILVGAVALVRALLRPVRPAAEPGEPRLPRHLAREHKLLTLLGFGATVLMALFGRTELLLVALCFSGVGLVLTLRALARAGYAWRDEVGLHAAAALTVPVLWLFYLWDLRGPEQPWNLGPYVFVVAVGGALCLHLSREGALPSARRNRSAAVFGLTLLAVSLGVLAAVVPPGGPGRVGTRDELRQWVETFEPREDRVSDWEVLAHVTWALGPDAELDPLAVLRAWNACADRGKAFSGVTRRAWSTGLLDPAEVSARLDAAGARRAVKPRARHDAARVGRDAWLLDWRGELDEALRDELADAVLVPSPGMVEYEDLSTWVDVVRALDVLGRSDRIEEVRDEIRQCLRESWTGAAPVVGERAAFSKVASGLAGAIVLPADPGESVDAVFLMERVGVPDGIDLDPLERFLELRSAPASWLHWLLEQRRGRELPWKEQAAAGLSVLRTRLRGASDAGSGAELPSPALLALVTFAAICVWVTRRAPVRGPDDPRVPRDFFTKGVTFGDTPLTRGRPWGARWTPPPSK